MARIKAILALVTCLWCPPVVAGFVWAVVTYFGGGLLCAYLIGLRPSGVLVWSRVGLFEGGPPSEMPVYIKAGKYAGVIPFSRIESRDIVPDHDGWYLLEPFGEQSHAYWLAGAAPISTDTPESGLATELQLQIDGVDVYLISSRCAASGLGVSRLTLRMMNQYGTGYVVEEEFRDGAVRPLRFYTIPDSMPALMGAVISTGLYTCLSVLPVCVAGVCGYKLSHRVRVSVTKLNAVEQEDCAYESS